MGALGEFDLIARYFSRPSRNGDVLLGIGDDAAVVRSDRPIAVAVDTLVAGVHFPESLDARAVGHRALAVNLSDMAAMGARPRWATLALTIPQAEASWLDAFAAGLYALAERFGVSLIGGDTTRGPLTVTLQIMGTLDGGGALTRGGGQVGDDVYVSGTLGDAAAALAAMVNGRRPVPAGLWSRFAYPEPRIALGCSLVSIATAAIDVSDGLVADLGHICERSGCGAVVELETLPLSESMCSLLPDSDARRMAATGGDDYELCFTAPPAVADDVLAAAAAAETSVRRVGRLTDGPGVSCRLNGDPVELAGRGYAHF